MTLHFSHIGLTEARTFIAPFVTLSKRGRARSPGDGSTPTGKNSRRGLAFQPSAGSTNRRSGCVTRPTPSGQREVRWPPCRWRSSAPAPLGRSRCWSDSVAHQLVPRREDPRTVAGDRHGVLEVGRQRAVLGVDGPV